MAGDVVRRAGEDVQRALRRWHGYLTVSGAKVAATAVGLVLSVATARLLGPAGRGEFIALTTAVALGAQLLNFGMSSALALEFARRPEVIRSVLRRCWLGALLLAAGIAAAGEALALVAPERAAVVAHWWPALAAWIPLQLLGLYQIAAATALGRIRGLAAIEVGGRTLATAAGLTALWGVGDSVASLVLALVVTEAIVAGATFVWLNATAPTHASAAAPLPARSELARTALRAYPQLLLPFAVVRADLLIVTALRGPAEAGVYSIAAQVVSLLLVLPSTANALAFPDVVRSRSRNAAARRLAWEVGLACVPLAIAVGVAAPWIVRVLFGAPYQGAVAQLRILLPGFVCLAVQSALAQSLAARGYPLALSAVWVLGLAVNLAGNALLVPTWGADGAAVVSTLTYALVAALVWLQVRGEVPVAALAPAQEPAA